jgi:hypothetical protein
MNSSGTSIGSVLEALYARASLIPHAHAIIAILVYVSPIILLVVLIIIFSERWLEYVRAKYFFKEGSAVIEIKLPKETLKSPAAMELFLAALHNTGGESSWYDRYWLGKTRPWFSLEMASIEGQVHFFIWTRKSNKDFIATALYAQFPGIEVHDTEDYAQTVHLDTNTMAMWAGELQFTQEYKGHMTSAYPIKTYVDYGLADDPKEEFKVDPIVPLIEFLGSVGANQQAWVQILVRAYKKDDHTKPGHLWKSHDRWREEAREIVNEIHKRDPKTKISGVEDEDTGLSKKPTITKGEEEVVTAIERNIAKLGFDVGVRILYIAKKDNFSPAISGGFKGIWKQFNAEHMNGFKPNGDLWDEDLSYPWNDFHDHRKHKYWKQALAVYKRRSFFYAPYVHLAKHRSKIMVMSSESLATLYHFPGQVAATPSFQRVASKKSEAPANLPV